MDLADMLKQWETTEFPITVYKDTDIKILGNIEDIQVRKVNKMQELYLLNLRLFKEKF